MACRGCGVRTSGMSHNFLKIPQDRSLPDISRVVELYNRELPLTPYETAVIKSSINAPRQSWRWKNQLEKIYEKYAEDSPENIQ